MTCETSLVGPGAVPLRVVRESERLSAHVRTLLPGLAHPVQVQHAREDEICRLASVRREIAQVPTGLLSLHVLENSYHMITADNDRHLVADRLSAFLQGLDARDFELLDHAPPLQPGRFQRLFPGDFGGLDVAAGDYLGLPDLAVGVDALGAFR